VPNWNSRGTIWKRLLHGFKEPPFTPITEFSMMSLVGHGDAHVRQFSLASFTELIRSADLAVDYVGGAGFIDGPKIGPIVKLTNRSALFRWLTFSMEKVSARIPLLKALSRHVVLRARKL